MGANRCSVARGWSWSKLRSFEWETDVTSVECSSSKKADSGIADVGDDAKERTVDRCLAKSGAVLYELNLCRPYRRESEPDLDDLLWFDILRHCSRSKIKEISAEVQRRRLWERRCAIARGMDVDEKRRNRIKPSAVIPRSPHLLPGR